MSSEKITAKDIRQELKSLGETPDEVAETLAKRGCCGKRREGRFCPVALNIKFRFLGRFGDESFVIETTKPVQQFIRGFDNGEYPELEAGWV